MKIFIKLNTQTKLSKQLLIYRQNILVIKNYPIKLLINDELGAFGSLKQLNKKQTLDELDVEGIVAKITKIPKKL